ncbi:hypothetical protein A9Y87_14705 [Salmonella enterica subsp. enterica]|nr:hypothetical protein A9Y87_14705 [Salmonella enterica subsp. enterica]
MFLTAADAPPVNRFSGIPLGEGETIIARKDRRIEFVNLGQGIFMEVYGNNITGNIATGHRSPRWEQLCF